MSRSIVTILLLLVSNTFMTLAWYGHLKFKELGWFKDSGWFIIVLVSWALAFFEYCFQVPANRMGFKENGGQFSLMQLKVIQEVITLVVFIIFSRLAFSSEQITSNQLIACALLIVAVFFAFR